MADESKIIEHLFEETKRSAKLSTESNELIATKFLESTRKAGIDDDRAIEGFEKSLREALITSSKNFAVSSDSTTDALKDILKSIKKKSK